MCRERLHHGTLATEHVSNRPRGAKLIRCLTQALVGCPAIPAETKGDKQPRGGLSHGRSSSTSQSGGILPQGRFPASPSFQLNTGLPTSCPYPAGRAQLQASASVTLLGCNLEMAPLGQNDPLPVPPVIWPLQFSVILCMGPGRQGADATLISLSLSKGYMSEAI